MNLFPDSAHTNERYPALERQKMYNKKDVKILRDLAKQYIEICAKEIQDERRELWRKHNSLKKTRPMVLCLWWGAIKEIIDPYLECEDEFFRGHERFLRKMIFQDYTGDDFVCEPWITQRAKLVFPEKGPWGLECKRISASEAGGAWKGVPPIKDLKDAEKMVKPRHVIDEEDTERRVSRLHDAIGDILEINVDRSPNSYRNFSNALGNLRGIEQLMWDMYDNPEWLHRLLAFMRDGILETNEQAEKTGDWNLANHLISPIPYEENLEAPKANSKPVMRKQLWAWFDAQEYDQVSPEMHYEFMLQYQIPIMEKFALTHYGCCENLTDKIDILRKISNLRSIGVAPWADIQKCAEQIKDDYIFSWHPNPTDMGCCGFDPDKIRAIMEQAMQVTKDCHVKIVLKDVQTVEGHPERLKEWTKIVRDVF